MTAIQLSQGCARERAAEANQLASWPSRKPSAGGPCGKSSLSDDHSTDRLNPVQAWGQHLLRARETTPLSKA
ncbi:hypothetical protein J1614_011157 [Plenodomus biglobosus]|nr:hypothetical protein J1614_011157 [Plenodomus biglobosus]